MAVKQEILAKKSVAEKRTLWRRVSGSNAHAWLKTAHVFAEDVATEVVAASV